MVKAVAHGIRKVLIRPQHRAVHGKLDDGLRTVDRR